MARPLRRSLPPAVVGAWLATLAAAAAAAAAPPPPTWHVAINGQPLGVPSPVVGGRLVLPVGALAKALGDVIVAAGPAGIALEARGGPPEAYLSAPASVLLGPSNLGPGYSRAASSPGQTPALQPGDAASRLAVASVTYTLQPAKDLKKLPVSVGYGPAEIAVTAAEYAGAAQAAAALADTVGPLAAHTVAWPGVAGPYTPVEGLPGPLGDAAAVWSAHAGKIFLAAVRVNNWVVTSAAGGTSLATAWTLWLEQVHRIEAVPRPTPVPSGAPGQAAPLPTADEGALPVSQDGVPLGTAVWTSVGYAVPVGMAAQALELAPERTGQTSLNLQGEGLMDNGSAPAVIAPPQSLILSPSATWGVPFARVAGAAATNGGLEQANPSLAYQLADWGRLGGYSLEFSAKPRAAARSGAPESLFVGLVEFSTAAGAYQAVLTEAGAFGHIQAGARPLSLGQLNGPGGVGSVTAVTAQVFGKKVTTRDDWFLLQVDNWEVVVGAADPNGYYTPRTLWPYLTALARNIELDGRAAP